MKEFNTFSADDLAKSWSLIEFLLEVYPQEFLQFIKTFPKGGKSMTYLEKMLKISPKELNEEWKTWAQVRY